ncbi:thioredoxin family protein [Roseivirga sp. E12]|uniref:thioredoxin family protein n=1 Tax=Roseivirga sp. E12 TaxID=2819237 RepID=UPI001ABCB33A|nr:thioredoxin family protein [Roseivirga sp. E12]MBO3700027.1 thioredoxin family protein [Roseivirga sp. E12]
MSLLINHSLINEAYDYASYREFLDNLLEEGKTTGANQSESMINYATLNQRRMKKWEKIGKITPELMKKMRSIDQKMTWLVITEGWCGDAAQNLPFLNKMAELNSNIDLRFVLRDENLPLIDAFLTNGGRSIPKLIALDDSLDVLGTWGPRPEPVQKAFLANKVSQERTGKEFTEYLHLWYAKDKGLTLQNEFLAILDVWNQKLQSLPVQAG